MLYSFLGSSKRYELDFAHHSPPETIASSKFLDPSKVISFGELLLWWVRGLSHISPEVKVQKNKLLQI